MKDLNTGCVMGKKASFFSFFTNNILKALKKALKRTQKKKKERKKMSLQPHIKSKEVN